MAKPKKLLSAKAIRRIRKMIDAVKAHPETYDQDQWPFLSDFFERTCNTPYCAAGHLVNVAPEIKARLKDSRSKVSWSTEALKALGLDTVEGISSSSLFGSSNCWPAKYAAMHDRAENFKTEKAQRNGKVRAFATRWEGFIETDGKDAMYENL